MYLLPPPMIVISPDVFLDIHVFGMEGIDFLGETIYWNHLHLEGHMYQPFSFIILIYTQHRFYLFVYHHRLTLHIS